MYPRDELFPLLCVLPHVGYSFGWRSLTHLPALPCCSCRANSKVTLDRGTSIVYEKLLVATGASAIKPPAFGDSTLYLRDLTDAEALTKRLDAAKAKADAGDASGVVVIGGGFIGVEVCPPDLQLGADH